MINCWQQKIVGNLPASLQKQATTFRLLHFCHSHLCVYLDNRAQVDSDLFRGILTLNYASGQDDMSSVSL